MLESLTEVGSERIINAYSGRLGCMCGCRGKWHDTRAQKTRILNKLRKAQQNRDPRVRVGSSSLEKDVTIVSAVLGQREYILHVK